jgi:menaquinone-dependent protoporphyrinogen IX oxidase
VNGESKPKVLIVYYTFTKQTGLVVQAMADRFAERGCEVTTALLEFTDPRHGKKFSTLPMHWPVVKIVSMLPAQVRRKTGEIGIPPEAQGGDYDLVVFGSPTWWLTTNMPVRSYLESSAAGEILDGKPFAAASVSRRYWKGNINGIRTLGERDGGTWVDETHFVATGNQVTSMLSWLAFMFFGGPRGHFLGIPLPKPNLKPDYEEQARSFADGLVGTVTERRPATVFET